MYIYKSHFSLKYIIVLKHLLKEFSTKILFRKMSLVSFSNFNCTVVILFGLTMTYKIDNDNVYHFLQLNSRLSNQTLVNVYFNTTKDKKISLILS